MIAAGPLFTSLSGSTDKKIVHSLVSLGIPKEASEALEQHILKDKYLVLMELDEVFTTKVKEIFWNSKALDVAVY